MNKSVFILIIDDSKERIDDVIRRMRQVRYEPVVECVHTPKAFQSALSKRNWSMVLFNPHMKSFGASKALRLLQESGRPRPPLIFMPEAVHQKGADTQRPWANFLSLLAANAPEVIGSEAETDRLMASLITSNESLRQVIQSKKMIQKSLEEKEEHFRALVLNASDLIISTRADGTIIYVSPSAETLLGLSPEQLTGTILFDHFHPQDAEWARKIREDFVRQEGRNMEVTFRMKNAKGLWVDFRGIVSNLLHHPSVRAVVTNAREVTEQKNREKEREDLLRHLQALTATVQEQAGKLNAVIDSMTIPLLIYDAEGRISRANAATTTALGFDPTGMDCNGFLQRISSHLMTGEKAQPEDVVSSRALKGETVRGQLYRFQISSGEDRVAFCSASPIRIRDRIIGAVTAWEDITERERLNQALKEARDDLELQVAQRTAELSEAIELLKQEIRVREEVEKQVRTSSELLERIFSNSQFLIAYMDAGFNFIRVNEAFARSDDHTPDFYPGRNHFHLFPDEENERIFRRVVRTGEPYNAFAKPLRNKKNPEHGFSYWDWNLQPVKSESGEVQGIILFLVDVTKRVEAEKNLTRMQTELIRSEHLSEIGILASTVAHELRNPLAVIETACFNIRHKDRNPAIDKNLANIEECLEESSQIINNLLFYARRKLPSYETFPICALLTECIAQAKERFRGKKVRIEKRCRLNVDTQMEADPLQMKELFGNILSNALDAVGNEGGKITVSTALKNHTTIRIDFRDNGPGIPKGVIKKVQMPFFSTKSKGTGLGLAVCRQITDLHDGGISIQSAEGEGTTVTVTLPLRKGK